MLFFTKQTELVIRYVFTGVFLLVMVASIFLASPETREQLLMYGIAGIAVIGIVAGINRMNVQRGSAIFEISFCLLALVLILFVF